MANNLEDEMRLTFAIIDLKRDLVEERTRADTANKALALATRQTTDLAEEKEAALAMRDEAKTEVEQAKLQSNHFREELRKAQVLVEKLTNNLHEARNLRPVLDQTAVNQLHATITARDSKIEQLVDKYDRLQSEHFTMQRQANKSSEERQSYQVKNENLAIEFRDLGAKLTAVETSRNRYRKECTDLLARNIQTVSHTQAANLSTENSKLKSDIEDLNTKIRDLKWDIGFYITDLDLTAAHMRVFTCRHRNFSDIPDGRHSTREKTAGVVAWQFFQDYQRDDEFIERYNDARQFTLEHHRAHEAINQGRATWASELKIELERIDRNRGVATSYR